MAKTNARKAVSQEEPQEKKKNTLKTMERTFKELHRLAPGAIPLTLLDSLTKPILPFINIYFSAKIIDVLSGSKDVELLITYVLSALVANFLLFIVSHVMESVRNEVLNYVYVQEQNEISKTLFKTEYNNLEDASFQEKVNKYHEGKNNKGSFLCRLTWAIGDQIAGAMTVGIAIAMVFPLFKIGFTKTGESFVETPWLLAILVVLIAVAVVVILIVSRKLSKAWFGMNDKFLITHKTFVYYLEMLNDYRTGKEIRVYNEQKLIEKDATQRMLTTGMKLNREMAKNSAKTSSSIAIIGALLGFGVYLFIAIKGSLGLFSLGSLVQYMGAFMQVVSGVTVIASTFGAFAQIIPSLGYYFDVMDVNPTREKGNKSVPMHTDYEIEFRDVSFCYPSADVFALRHFSLKITKEDHLAVVGRNGSGKTTFIKLLCRMYDPTEGEILLNGVNIKEYKEEQYQKLFSVVFQDFCIFSLPLGQSVACAEQYEDEKLWQCLEESGADKLAQGMPKKLETYLYKHVDKEGVEISGGEAQKLALSRALYKEAPFVVLDEPTAALDPIAEYDIYSKFNHFVEKKAAIYISHRLSSCRFCNQIAVFDGGELVQLGTHEALIEDRGNKYFELWNAQAQYYCEGV